MRLVCLFKNIITYEEKNGIHSSTKDWADYRVRECTNNELQNCKFFIRFF